MFCSSKFWIRTFHTGLSIGIFISVLLKDTGKIPLLTDYTLPIDRVEDRTKGLFTRSDPVSVSVTVPIKA